MRWIRKMADTIRRRKPWVENILQLLDWADWMMTNAGSKGRLEVCKVIATIVKETP